MTLPSGSWYCASQCGPIENSPGRWTRTHGKLWNTCRRNNQTRGHRRKAGRREEDRRGRERRKEGKRVKHARNAHAGAGVNPDVRNGIQRRRSFPAPKHTHHAVASHGVCHHGRQHTQHKGLVEALEFAPRRALCERPQHAALLTAIRPDRQTDDTVRRPERPTARCERGWAVRSDERVRSATRPTADLPSPRTRFTLHPSAVARLRLVRTWSRDLR